MLLHFSLLSKSLTMLTRGFLFQMRLFSKLHHCAKASTIFALSSGFGKCGVAVIRISGPDSKEVLYKMAEFHQLPQARLACLRKIRNPADRSILDNGLVLWFPGPKSFTGEDCCELQIHGGKAVITSVLKTLSELRNFRPALPGEFAKRAFYSGKLDLTEAEGLSDLIEAETEAQRKQAVSQMDGALSRIYSSWKDSMTKAAAQIEAFIDFGESENIEDNLLDDTKASVGQILNSIRKHLVDGRRGERLRSGVQAVILGAPNVGKSSLLNILCRKEEAIVSSIAGTTRDIVTSALDIGGYPLVIKDTAGLRQRESNTPSVNTSKDSSTSDPIEIEGISRALSAARSADLILLVADPSHLPSQRPLPQSLSEYFDKIGLEDFKTHSVSESSEAGTRVIKILNKVDLVDNRNSFEGIFDVVISCKHEEGVDKLTEVLTQNLQNLCGSGNIEDASCNQLRHRHCLNEVVSHLDTCLVTNEPDLIANHLRQALYSLGKITGHVSTEQILDVIFKNFCVGK